LSIQYKFCQVTISSVARLVYGWKVFGRDNIPEGGALIASNHLSNFDPPFLGSAIKREMFYFAKIELFRNPLFGALIKSVNAFPVHRGEADRQAWKVAKSLLKTGKLLLFFPEGTRSRDGQLQDGKPGMARLAFAADVPVVPAAISGSNRLRDVFLRRAKLRVGFAKPITLSDFASGNDDDSRYDRLTKAVMAEIGRLKAEVEAA
jgi:1-acyl-sn-glycerol-3-phosphate acyltransferase